MIHESQVSFNAGELSPLMDARTNVEKYASGCRQMRNFVLHTHGPVFRRPGTEYLGEVYNTAEPSRLLEFVFSNTTTFIIEMARGCFRFWSQGRLVVDKNGNAITAAHSYLPAEFFQVQARQINNVVYFAHANHPPLKLTREEKATDDDGVPWKSVEMPFTYPPLLDENVEKDFTEPPAVEEKLRVNLECWPEFELEAGGSYSIELQRPVRTGNDAKNVIVDRWVPATKKWAAVRTLTWANSYTAAPSASALVITVSGRHRIRYTGKALPLHNPTAAGLRSGATVYRDYTSEEDKTRLAHLDLCSNAPYAPSVIMPAGDWQATAVCGSTIATGAALYVQKKVSGKWSNVTILKLAAGKSVAYSGAPLTTPTEMRLAYVLGTASSGHGLLERLVYPVHTVTTVTPSHTSEDPTPGAPVRTLTASTPLFVPSDKNSPPPADDETGDDEPEFYESTGSGETEAADEPATAEDALVNTGHENAYFQIVHRRELSYTELVGVNNSATPATPWAVRTSQPLRVVGKWDLFTYGLWKGQLFLERRASTGGWEILRTWTGNYDRNIVSSGEQDKDGDLRLRVNDAMVGKEAGGANVPRFVLESADSRSYGLVKITAVHPPATGADKATVADVKVLREIGTTQPTTLWAEGAWSGHRGYPAAVALHQGRLWFGGTRSRPQGLWGSVSGDFENFRRSTYDDGSIAILLASETANPIRWLGSAPGGLLVGTGGEEWAITGSNDDGIITPVSVKAQRQSGYSSSAVPARLAQDVTLFVQRDGRRLRQLIYDSAQQGYSASDLTVLASHVTRGGIVQLAFQQAPTPIVWAVTGTGRLIGMTFEREQNVFGWHVHDTDGFIESVAVIPGTPSDEVWLVVNRPHPDDTLSRPRRMVERFSLRGDASSWSHPLIYSDSAVVVANPSQDLRVGGFRHLAGRTVQVLADGCVHAPCLVDATGYITLSVPATQIIAGLRYDSVLQPMKREVALADGTAQGRRFKLNGVTLRVDHSLGGEINANPDDPTLPWERIVDRRVATPMNGRPALYTGEHTLHVESRHEQALNLCIRQSEPLPFNLTALILRYDTYAQQ